MFSFTSQPSPDVMSSVLDTLLQESFVAAFESTLPVYLDINDLKIRLGISLETIVKELYLLVINL